MTLASAKCVACRRGAPTVTDDEVEELHPQVPGWEFTDVDSIKRLKRAFKIRDFAATMEFASRIGEAAEEEGHHPRLTVEWGRVGVEWWTHKIRGLHRNDFIMAAKSDRIFEAFAGGQG